jgi:hypothetical protein
MSPVVDGMPLFAEVKACLRRPAKSLAYARNHEGSSVGTGSPLAPYYLLCRIPVWKRLAAIVTDAGH